MTAAIWEVLYWVGVDGVGGMFPFFIFFFCLFVPLLFFFSHVVLGQKSK